MMTGSDLKAMLIYYDEKSATKVALFLCKTHEKFAGGRPQLLSKFVLNLNRTK